MHSAGTLPRARRTARFITGYLKVPERSGLQCCVSVGHVALLPRPSWRPTEAPFQKVGTEEVPFLRSAAAAWTPLLEQSLLLALLAASTPAKTALT
ncbi:hypothetical protein AAFF_G00248300 [Aldrovandia affinis]|uniref:Uncharacterized protein n=1 Tax=Aldrovandia affinis TaxID=143900 RepID=A0AAD7RDL2_9TELE|nr:hypothetical protein AAFF_G00248300 [Aldrovandia affinis]